MNPQPKVKPWRSEKYRRWVASLMCCACHSRFGSNAHHHQEEGHGTMAGKCCDSRCIPLCIDCHAEVHRIGNKAFWRQFAIKGDEHVTMTRNSWEFKEGGRPWEDR